jgi:two-component sensor histidine kinase
VLIIKEAATNLSRYAFPDRKGDMDGIITFQSDNGISITIAINIEEAA